MKYYYLDTQNYYPGLFQRVYKRGTQLILCFYQLSLPLNVEYQGLVLEDAWTFDELDKLLPDENRPYTGLTFPDPRMKGMTKNITIGAKEPGYYALIDVIKFDVTSPVNKTPFEMKGPQRWIFPCEPKRNFVRAGYNAYPMTKEYRDASNSFFHREDIISPVNIVRKFDTTSMDDTVFVMASEYALDVDDKDVKVLPFDRDMVRAEIPVPVIVIDSDQIDTGGKITATIRVVDNNGKALVVPKGSKMEVFIEEKSGYASKKRISLSNPDETFSIMALGLDAGDILSIKAGWAFMPGLSETNLTVI